MQSFAKLRIWALASKRSREAGGGAVVGGRFLLSHIFLFTSGGSVYTSGGIYTPEYIYIYIYIYIYQYICKCAVSMVALIIFCAQYVISVRTYLRRYFFFN